MKLRDIIAPVIPSRQEWHEYLVDATFTLIGLVSFALLEFLIELLTGTWGWPPAIPARDLHLLVVFGLAFMVGGFVLAAPYGLLAGSMIRRLLGKRSRRGSIPAGEALRLGAMVGALAGVLFDVIIVIPHLAVGGPKFMPRYGLLADSWNWSFHTVRAVTIILWSALTVAITTLSGAIRARQLHHQLPTQIPASQIQPEIDN